MFIHTTQPLFAWDSLEDSPSLATLRSLLESIPDAELHQHALEGIEQATLFDPTGRCVVVSLPAPARYAVHKLLVVGERSGAFRAKIAKDVAQAASLIEYFANADPDPLHVAWQDARARGPGWRKRADEGLKALRTFAPLQAALLATER